jgi:hypothetical protein
VGGEGSGGTRVCTRSATSVTEKVCVAPPTEVYRRVGPNRLGVGSRMSRGCPCLAPNDGEVQLQQHGIDRGRGR